MSIEISGISHTKVPESTDDAKLKQSAEPPPSKQDTGGSSSSDTVSISDNAAQLGKLNNASVTTAVVDTQRVEQVKQAISNGSFEVDPAKIADKLMQFESILKPEG